MLRKEFKERMGNAYLNEYRKREHKGNLQWEWHYAFSCNRMSYNVNTKAKNKYSYIMGRENNFLTTVSVSYSGYYGRTREETENFRLTLMMLFEQYALSEKLYKEL